MGNPPCSNWTEFGVCYKHGKGKCDATHPQSLKGPTAEGKAKLERWRTQDCKSWLKGSCFMGGTCRFKHDKAKQGPRQRVTADGGAAQPDAAPAQGAQGGGGGARQTRQEVVDDLDSAEPLFVFSRPTSFGASWSRRVMPKDKAYDFAAW